MDTPISPTASPTARQRCWAAVQALGSLKLAVPLLATLAAVIAVATVLEADHGRAYAQWYVYQSGWFVGLLALLGVNIFFAAISRWPWKRHQIGFVVTHLGLLVLLAGSIQTFFTGVEGQVTLAEGESASKMLIPQQTQITASWVGQPKELPYEFTFEAGPVSWREGKSLDLGELDGVAVRVLRYYRHARVVENWITDESATGGPVVRLRLQGPHGDSSAEHVLVDQDHGDEALVGPIHLRFQRATADVMLEDFLKPPTENMGQKGLLLAYHGNRVKPIAVDDHVGKTVALDGGAAVEIVEYLANAKPEPSYRFRSAGDEPRNPLLELRVHLPGEKEPLRQLAFAKSPLLNLDPILGRVCPIQFRYYHPAVKPPSAVEFLQTSDGRLHCRVFADNRLVPKGEVQAGSTIEMPGKFTFVLVEHLRHARQKITFESQDVDASQADKIEPAAEIEISAAGVTQTIWLQRNHPELGARSVVTPHGALRVRLGHGEAPLGFALKLVDFRREQNPGRAGNAAFSSLVRVVDQQQDVNEEREISMNQPLTRNGLTFYQSGFNEAAGHGAETSTLSVARDPGRLVKYAGSLMICFGIAIMFYMRAYFFKSVPHAASWRWNRDRSPVPEAAGELATDKSFGAGALVSTAAPEPALARAGAGDADLEDQTHS